VDAEVVVLVRAVSSFETSTVKVISKGTMSAARRVVVNPYKKDKQATPVPVIAKGPKPRHGPAQAEFIDVTRKAIKRGPRLFFVDKDWGHVKHATATPRCMLLTGKKSIRPEHFYVKDIAAWVPHLLTPNYVPTCPRCGQKSGVNVDRFRFVENPKILCGIHTHRCLDTVHCTCGDCKGDFAGWRPDCLQLDAKEIAGILNFRMSRGFAVDENLCSFIISHATDTAVSMHKKLRQMTATNWINDATFCCRATLSKKVKPKNHVFKEGSNQQSLDSIVAPVGTNKKIASLRERVTSIQRELDDKTRQCQGCISFHHICNEKQNRNQIGSRLPGVGKAKCHILVDRGINATRDLLECEGSDPAVKNSWVRTAQEHCGALHDDMKRLTVHLNDVKEELWIHEAIEQVEKEKDSEPDNPPPIRTEEAKPVPFSSLSDPIGHNAKSVSTATVDRITATDFQHRKALQLAKMRSTPSGIRKLDFGCKLAPKVKAWTGRGKCFAPFKSVAAMHNEDAMTIFWKFYHGSESIKTVASDLKLLNERNTLLGATLKAVHVDNCCNVRGVVVDIVPGVLVKLDCFHWQQRWNECLCDKRSEKTVMFRSLMRRAVFVTETSECNRAKEMLME